MAGDAVVRRRDRLFSFWRPAKSGVESKTKCKKVVVTSETKPEADVPSSVEPSKPPTFPPPCPEQQSSRKPTISESCLEEALTYLSPKDRVNTEKYFPHDQSGIHAAVEGAYHAALKQKSICEEKQWRAGKAANSVFKFVNRFRFVGDVVANVDPLHVGLPWAAVRLFLEVPAMLDLITFHAISDSRLQGRGV